MKQTIQDALQKALAAEGITDIAIQVTIPSDQTHGDFTSNVAMIAAKKIGKNPLEVAEGLKATLSDMAIEGIKDIVVVKPGFINFWLDPEFIISKLNESAMQGQALSKYSNGKKIMVEYTDPNPFKEFHIGHLYTNIVGESLARLFASQGNDVRRVCYQGDVGLHVAKSLWGMIEKGKAMGWKSHEEFIEKMSAMNLKQRVTFMGEAYVLGSQEYEKPEVKESINEINKQIYAGIAGSERGTMWELYEAGRQWTLDYFETIYSRLGTKFTRYYFESEAGPRGIKIVKENMGKVFEESDGAVVFKGEKHGLHTRVFINKLGLPTYEAKELGLAPWKYSEFPYDLSVIVTGNEINEYFQVLRKALSLIQPELAEKTKHIGHGMVRLPEGKMSSRTGNVISGEWMLDTAKEKITAAYPEMDEKTADIVAVAAVKYALLKNSIGKNIAFSFDESISFEGNSGPYLQYTYVRTQSVLSKWHIANGILKENHKPYAISNKHILNPYHDDLEPEEVLLLRILLQFDMIISEAAESLAPHLLANYLFDLCQKFNNFYQKHKILESEQKTFRVGLTAVVGETIKKGLDLLGIQVPEKM